MDDYHIAMRSWSNSDKLVCDELLGDVDTYGVWDRPDTTVVVDIGANIGAFTVLIARHYPAALTVAYEPEDDNYALLLENLAANACNASPHNIAIYDSTGTVTISAREGLTHVCDDAGICDSSMCQQRRQVVPCITLDQALQPYPVVDILKVDTEGAEFAIFGAASVETMRHVRYLCMEFHDCCGDAARIALWNKVNETHDMVSNDDIWKGERR